MGPSIYSRCTMGQGSKNLKSDIDIKHKTLKLQQNAINSHFHLKLCCQRSNNIVAAEFIM